MVSQEEVDQDVADEVVILTNILTNLMQLHSQHNITSIQGHNN